MDGGNRFSCSPKFVLRTESFDNFPESGTAIRRAKTNCISGKGPLDNNGKGAGQRVCCAVEGKVGVCARRVRALPVKGYAGRKAQSENRADAKSKEQFSPKQSFRKGKEGLRQTLPWSMLPGRIRTRQGEQPIYLSINALNGRQRRSLFRSSHVVGVIRSFRTAIVSSFHRIPTTSTDERRQLAVGQAVEWHLLVSRGHSVACLRHVYVAVTLQKIDVGR